MQTLRAMSQDLALENNVTYRPVAHYYLCSLTARPFVSFEADHQTTTNREHCGEREATRGAEQRTVMVRLADALSCSHQNEDPHLGLTLLAKTADGFADGR